MAYVRAFDNPSVLKLTSNDLSIRTRDKTIYNEIRKNVRDLSNNNPTKTNGYKYHTTTINVNCDISGGYVEYVDNYELKRSISNGRNLINSQCFTPTNI